ncbi:hypothetical protein Krad_2547 [Kineococcus radiotolerans SRS30216 = ATCC BAA-149]|uniref:Uncharacterized protein n=1 Tax=Kineococcus radiotolerans (strain ATCC BAA-149 / DSM 14245 / SRS30216) TaxID=266940 RepID=A6WB33_KINRD|nr:hypothetical protein Krad_2547 [Kineococcus radiotolerans SRS30216 = ATCC BAA-149]
MAPINNQRLIDDEGGWTTTVAAITTSTGTWRIRIALGSLATCRLLRRQEFLIPPAVIPVMR